MDGGSTGTRIVACSFDEAYDAAERLLRAHYDEIAKFKDLAILDPALERYRALEAEGQLITLLAYVGDQLAGYCCSIVQNNLHYKGLVFCQNDVLYVAPEFRGGRIFILLRRETKFRASEMGAKLMLWHSKLGTTLDALLERMGAEVLDIIRAERI